jgi:hypothetical protein
MHIDTKNYVNAISYIMLRRMRAREAKRKNAARLKNWLTGLRMIFFGNVARSLQFLLSGKTICAGAAMTRTAPRWQK